MSGIDRDHELTFQGPATAALETCLAHDHATTRLRWMLMEGATHADIELAQRNVENTWAAYQRALNALLLKASDARTQLEIAPVSGAV